MKNDNFFSVAMSVYRNDNPLFFDRALESITEKQTIKPNEIVLVVDGPVSQRINEVITKYQKKEINLVVIRYKENKGLGLALQKAVEKCSYELIARMDSDDISREDRFEQQLSIFKRNPDIDIVGGDISEFIDDEKNIVCVRKVPCRDKEIKEYMKKRCAFNHVSVMYKKESVLQAGGYRNVYFNEDYFLWIRMMEKKQVFANTGTVLVNVRAGKEMYARRGGKKYFKSEMIIQNYMLDHGIIKLVTYISNVLKRFIVQIILPNRIREIVFKKLARSNY